jgi:hypothetical protein
MVYVRMLDLRRKFFTMWIQLKNMHHLLKRPFRSRRFKRRRLVFFASLVLLLVIAPIIYLGLTHPWQIKAAPWPTTANDWLKRKQVSLVNNSGQTLDATTTYSITINTKELYDAGYLQADCSDLRMYYQPNESTTTKLAYYFDPAAGATDCSDSEVTKVYFPLQANLSNGSSTTGYYIYYDNDGATSEASVDAFDVGSKQALMVCPFNGDTECINGDGAESPTTESGAIRYSGGKSALSFDGSTDILSSNTTLSPSENFTIEFWVDINKVETSESQYNYILTSTNEALMLRTTSGWDSTYELLLRGSGGYHLTTGDFIISDGWHHIAITYDNQIGKVYLDGVLKQTVDAEEDIYSISSVQFGYSAASNKRGSNMYLDEVRVSSILRYTDSFSAYTNPFVRDEHTKLLLHFDENGDDPRNTGKAIDDSGNANHGTITGAKYVSGHVGVDTSTSDTGSVSSQSYADHSGLFIEEGTTNLITNPSFENGTFDAEWIPSEGSSVSTGPNSPGTVTNDATIGTTAWSSTSNATASDDTYAFTSGLAGANNYLKATNFGFAIPSGSTINGIVVEIERKGGGNGPNDYIVDNAVKIVKPDGTIGSTDKKSGSYWTSTESYATYGSSSDLWGETWTSDGINDSDFGIVLSAINPSPDYGATPYVDHFRIIIHYSPPAITTTQNTSLPYYKYGSSSAKLVPSTDATYTITVDPNSTATHTLSAYVYSGTSGAVGGTVNNTVAQLVWEGTAQSGTTYTDMGGGWWRLSYSTATTDASNEYGIYVLDTKTVYVDGVQLEAKGYASSYTDGTLGTGYAWSGTAHESTSSRTAAQSRYAYSDNITRSQGAVSIWYRVDRPNIDSNTSFGLFSLKDDTSQILGLQVSNCQWQSRFRDGSEAAQSFGGDCNGHNSSTGKWHHAVLNWEDGEQTLYRNNSLKMTTTFSTGSIPGGNPLLLIGEGFSAWDNAYTTNGAISNVRIFDQPLSSTEISDLYYSGLGSHQIQSDYTERFTGSASPVLSWKFDEATGTTAYDSSGKNNNGVIAGPSWSDDTFASTTEGNSLQFDGSNDLVSKTFASDEELNPSNQPFTVSAWFKSPSSTGSQHTIISRYNGSGYKVYLNSSGYICFGIDDDSTWGPDDSACSTTSFADSNWHLVTAVREATAITVYIDGVKVATNASLTSTGHLSGSNPTFYVGIDSDGTSNPWTGFIDEVRVYNHALTAAEILAEASARGSVKGVSSSFTGEGAEDALGQGLVGYWKMDEASWNGTAGEVIDSSGNENHAVRSGDATTTTGRFAKSGTFDGTGDYATIGQSSSLDVTDEFTFSAWVKTSDSANTLPLISKGSLSIAGTTNKFAFGLYQGKVWAVYRAVTGTTISTNTVSDNTWHYITWTFSKKNNQNTVYIDGKIDGEGYVSPTTTGQDSSDVKLGTTNISGFDYYHNGGVDEMRVYNRALSPAEIQALYNWAPQPVAYWDFNEGGGQSASDRSGNGNTMTLGSTAGTDVNDPSWTTGKFGNALNFDLYDDDYATVTSSSAPTGQNPWTLSLWAEIEDSTIGGRGYRSSLVHWGDSTVPINDYSYSNLTYVYTPPTTTIDWTTSPSSIVNLTSYSVENRWNYLTVTYDGTSVRTYFNGIFQTSANHTMAIEGSDIIFGGYPLSMKSYGKIDEVKIYNYARTTQQIVEDMNAGHPAPGSPVGSALVHLKLDEGFGEALHNSGNGGNSYAGDLGGSGISCPGDSACPTWSNSGKFDKALSFDGGDFAQLNPDMNLTDWTNLSISGWFYANTGSGIRVISSKFNEGDQGYGSSVFKIWLDTNDNLVFKLSTTGPSWPHTITGPPVTENAWHHFVANWDGSTQKLYLDGSLVGETTATGTLTNPQIITLGRESYTSSGYFNGFLDEIKFYNSTFSSDQVKAEYNAGKATVLGALSTTASGVASNASDRSYCPPGDTTVNCGPVGEWNFNENSGTTNVYDTSGNVNHGTMNGSMTSEDWIPGKVGSALDFDGNDFILISDNDSLDTAGSVTLQAWIKPSSLSNYATIVGKRHAGSTSANYAMRLGTGGSVDEIEFYFANGGWQVYTTSDANLVANNWYFVTAVYNGSSVKIYKNGVLLTGSCAAGTCSTSLVSDTNSFGIGRAGDLSSEYFSGLIDQVRIYSYARTPAQIAWDYNRGKPVAHWKFDECTGAIVHSSNETYNSALNGTWTGTGGGTQTSVGDCSTGGTAWGNGASGKFNGSLNFDGEDDRVTIPSNTNLNLFNELSFGAWIKTSQTDPISMNILSKGNFAFSGTTSKFGLAIATSGQVTAFYRNLVTSLGDTKDLRDGQWHHVFSTISTSSNSWKLYVDGKLTASSGVTAAASADTTGDLDIGTLVYDSEPGSFMIGQIDDVQIFNYALTNQQVQTVFNSGAIRYE